MKRLSFAVPLFTASLAFGQLTLPVQAHGIAEGGPLAGLFHPLLGADHLLMLLAVGTAASQLSLLLLSWALGGGMLGALFGSTGWTMPLQETLAALAIIGVAALTLQAGAKGSVNRALRVLSAWVVGGGMAIHGLLHGLEAPAGGSPFWWAGTLLSSAVVCGGSALLLRLLPHRWGRAMALAMLMAGGLLVIFP